MQGPPTWFQHVLWGYPLLSQLPWRANPKSQGVPTLRPSTPSVWGGLHPQIAAFSVGAPPPSGRRPRVLGGHCQQKSVCSPGPSTLREQWVLQPTGESLLRCRAMQGVVCGTHSCPGCRHQPGGGENQTLWLESSLALHLKPLPWKCPWTRKTLLSWPSM